MKYEKPMLFDINSFDFSEGDSCPSGNSAKSCGTGSIATPGQCSTGIGANPNCHNGPNATGKCRTGVDVNVI